MKKMRGLFSLVLCMVMLLMSVPFAGATDGSEADTVLNESAMDAYVQSVLPHYLSLKNDNVYGEIAVSQGYVVHGHNDPNARTYFVTDDGDYIANLFVTYINGQYSSNFGFDDNADVAAAIENDTPLALVVVDEMLILQTATGNILICAEEQQALSCYTIPVYNCTAPVLTEIEITKVAMAKNNSVQSKAVYTKRLYVPHVSNDNPDGEGICWAACIAAISNYRTGSSYQAIDIYNGLDDLFSGIPSGNPTWIMRGFNYCGLSPTYIDGRMGQSSVYSQLCASKPIYISIGRSGGAHAVVICYISYVSSPITLGFMDPNFTDVRYTEITSTSFYYVGAGYTYTSWNRSFY